MQQAQPQSGEAGGFPQQLPPQQPPVQQQLFPHQGLNGGWQSDKDYEERRKMIAKIVHLLQQRKPNAPQEWLKKLPQMAKRLEESLYRSAKSFNEYNDASTLKQRLQQLAVNIGMRTKKQQQQQALMQQQQQQQSMQPQPIQHPVVHHPQQQQQQPILPQQNLQQQNLQQLQQQQSMQQQQQQQHQMQQQNLQHQQQNLQHQQQLQQQQQQQQQQQNLQQHQQMQQQQQQQNLQQQQQQMHHQQQHQQQQHVQQLQMQQPQHPAPAQFLQRQPSSQAQVQQPLVKPQAQTINPIHTTLQPVTGAPRMVNMSEINPIMGGQPAAQHVQQTQQTASIAQPTQQQPLQVQYQQPQQQQPQHQQPQQQPPNPNFASVAQPVAPNPNATAPDANTNGVRQIANRQQVLRHQQQRLLLLRHAAKCQHEDGLCPVTPHCAGMKRLWKHIAECKNQKCLVPHCVSSRYVLSHYHRCKDVRCPVCGPVREAIHRSHEKQKHMQALKQRHQQAVQQNQQAPAVAAGPQPVPQPVAPAPAVPALAQPVPSLEPPVKKQKTSAVLTAPSFQLQQRPLQQPSRPSLPGLPAAIPSSAPFPQQSQSIPTAQPPPQVAAPQPPQVQIPPAPVQPTSAPQVASAPGIAFSNGQVIMPKHAGPKPQEDHTLINCFSVEQIETHIESLNNGLQLPPLKLKTKCLEVLKTLQSHQHAWVFNTPVDPVELGLPDYFEVIKKPMDLGTIRKKLENGIYTTLEAFEGHVLLTFENAMLYNPEGSVVYNMAKEMKEKFERDYAVMIEILNEEEDVKRKNGEACLLCGCEKLLFEPPVFYCNGLNCASKRIRRNSYYYVGGNNQYHWCHQCYQELRDNSSIDLGDITVKKESLTKKKNDEVHEESWVQCDRCERWVHQICALFNTRQNKDQRSEYACPRCTVEERRKNGNLEATSSTPMAEDLPRTKLSEFLENHVRQKVDEFVEKNAIAKSSTENISLDEARTKLQMGGAVTIRQVTSMDRKLEVRERMKKRYAFKNYPEEFTFRCKCIVVFQNLDGVDVILFGLYVYEHDDKIPPPNHRAVYISYLDSVHYMRPRSMRTFVYHEILIAYMDYVRRRGFSTVHIWACPPLKGDDYILYAKPEDQKTPKDDRLRQWYIEMLLEAQKRGIVGKLTNMYDLYFANPRNDATIVPYMDGDYFPAEAENIIKDMEEGKTGKKGSSKGKNKDQKAKQKKKSGRGGTRSTGYDEDALKASGILPPGSDQKSLEEGGRDYVMTKLGETIHPMKDSFIVAFLSWEGASEADMVVPKDVEEYRRQNNIEWRLKPQEDYSIMPDDGQSVSVDRADGNTSDVASLSNVDRKDHEKQDDNATNGHDQSHENTTNQHGDCSSIASSGSKSNAVNMSIREGKFAAMAARKRDRVGMSKDVEKKDSKPKESRSIYVKDSKGRMIKVLDDDDEEMDCEFLNNRQAFLNLCQGNHYQFDQLRRAKHSSMMVLWHLHNRDAPKFVQQCATCSREILSGVRYHCPTCADFDQCQECVSNPNVPRHAHPLKPVSIGNGQQNELTEAQRKERQRSIQLHMTLLQHAATCNSPNCPSANCTKMKGLLKHGVQCQVKATGGCNVCKRIWALLQIHARQCKATSCPVPNCMAIRERVRQLKKQQQAMDDRRRQEMNRAYRGKR